MTTEAEEQIRVTTLTLRQAIKCAVRCGSPPLFYRLWAEQWLKGFDICARSAEETGSRILKMNCDEFQLIWTAWAAGSLADARAALMDHGVMWMVKFNAAIKSARAMALMALRTNKKGEPKSGNEKSS